MREEFACRPDRRGLVVLDASKAALVELVDPRLRIGEEIGACVATMNWQPCCARSWILRSMLIWRSARERLRLVERYSPPAEAVERQSDERLAMRLLVQRPPP